MPDNLILTSVFKACICEIAVAEGIELMFQIRQLTIVLVIAGKFPGVPSEKTRPKTSTIKPLSTLSV